MTKKEEKSKSPKKCLLAHLTQNAMTDVTSPRGDGSCPTMTGLCSRVDGGNGTDTVKAKVTDITLNFISLCLSFEIQN